MAAFDRNDYLTVFKIGERLHSTERMSHAIRQNLGIELMVLVEECLGQLRPRPADTLARLVDGKKG